MAKRAFITGITGQDGAYLSRFLLEKGYEVHGGSRRTSGSSTARLEELGIAGDIVLHNFDLLDFRNVQDILDRVAPDEIYNLAAQSFVGTSFHQPIHSSDISALGTMRLLECLRHAKSKARFYQASTSELFGLPAFHPRGFRQIPLIRHIFTAAGLGGLERLFKAPV